MRRRKRFQKDDSDYLRYIYRRYTLKIAVVGATGAVGQQMIICLEERLPDAEVKALASTRSAGKTLKFKKEYVIEELKEDSFTDVDYVLGATENAITALWAPNAVKAGAIVVDNSSLYRLDENVPLVIPEINGDDIRKHNGIIANPNCATIIALMAVNAIHQRYRIEKMIVSTYQAVSGAGVQGMHDLENQVKDPSIPSVAFPHPIAYNLIPQIGSFDDEGYSSEERKMQNEGRKIWHDEQLLVNCTCVRVPTMRSHCESIALTCREEIDLEEVRELLKHAEGVVYADDPQQHVYPTPLITADQDMVYVGRLRKDVTDTSNHSLVLFCAGDQIRKGAATNTVQILEKLIEFSR